MSPARLWFAAALVLGVAARIADRALSGGAADVTTVLVALMLVCICIGATSWFRRSQR